MPATVVALFLSSASRAPLQRVDTASALADRGLDGDRHARPGNRRSVLLMEQETLDTLGLSPGDVREQVTVRGLGLMTLAPGTRLRIGGAVLLVGKECAPCERMEELRTGLQSRLEGRRGRFVTVLADGAMTPGDTIQVDAPA